MSKLSAAFQSILDDIAVNFLQRKARQFRAQYPPMVLFAHDYIGTQINVFGMYERDILEALAPLLDQNCKGGVALDIGANIGSHTVFFSKFFSEVHAFEPNPAAFRLLKINTEYLGNVVLHEFGLSDRQQTLRASVPITNRGGASLASDEIASSNQEPAIDFKLECYREIAFEVVGRVGIVKIDVEGHEAAVIRGMLELLREDHPLVMFESNFADRQYSSSDGDIFEMLRTCGYDQFHEMAGRSSVISNRLPRPLKWPLRAIERLIRGSSTRAYLSPIDQLESRNYPAILASIKGDYFIDD